MKSIDYIALYELMDEFENYCDQLGLSKDIATENKYFQLILTTLKNALGENHFLPSNHVFEIFQQSVYFHTHRQALETHQESINNMQEQMTLLKEQQAILETTIHNLNKTKK